VRAAYPQFTFRHNADWPNNNILASLMCAEDLMDRPFITTYSDILYKPQVIRDLIRSTDDISLCVDTEWLQHYQSRSCHPTTDAEKVKAGDGRVISVSRNIPEEDTYGEFIGVAKFSSAGAAQLRAYYHRCRESYAGREFRGAATFELSGKGLTTRIELGERDRSGSHAIRQKGVGSLQQSWRMSTPCVVERQARRPNGPPNA